MKKRRRFAWAIGGAAAIVSLGWLSARSYAPYWHPSDSLYPRQGIDVSHYQGRIDWPALPGQGVDFAYIKASEGGDLRDTAFAANWAGARRAGIARGAYHFFTLCRPGADQAANFIAAVPLDPEALPAAIDLEDMGPCPRPIAPADFRAELAAFITLVEARYGKPVRLYLTEEFDRTYEISAHFDRPLWLRSIFWAPAFGARPWAMWQASDFRRLGGIHGSVDWNVARP
jgi:lysozyme